MDFTWLQLLIAFLGSSGIIGGGFTLIKFFYEQFDKRKAARLASEDRKQLLRDNASDKASDAAWRLVEERNQECKRLNLVIEGLAKEISAWEKDDSLSRPTITRIYQAVRKVGKQIEILD